MAEIETTCLQYSHNLESIGWLPMEWDAFHGQDTPHESSEGYRADFQWVLLTAGELYELLDNQRVEKET